MSDSHAVYQQGRNEEKKIKSELEKLTTNELRELKSSISVDKEFVNRYFAEYFESLSENKKEISVKSKVFTTAWTYVKTHIAANILEALKMAWKRIKVVQALQSGIAYFSYKKATGELRKAIGTLREGNFNYTHKTNNSKKSKLDVIRYFDIEAKAFRSFRIERLIQIEPA